MGSDNENTGPDGMPDMSAAEKAKSKKEAVTLVAGMTVVSALVGFGIAYALFAFTGSGAKAAYTKRIEAVTAQDLHWAFLAAYVFTRLVGFVNMYPVIYKQQCMRAKSGNLRANPFVYKLQRENGVEPGVVVLATADELGQYNRANRSLHHMVETMAPLAVGMYMCATVFPQLAFAYMCAFALGRVLHQVGYSSPKGYGAHAQGFMLHMLANEAQAGSLLLVGLKGLGVF